MYMLAFFHGGGGGGSSSLPPSETLHNNKILSPTAEKIPGRKPVCNELNDDQNGHPFKLFQDDTQTVLGLQWDHQKFKISVIVIISLQ